MGLFGPQNNVGRQNDDHDQGEKQNLEGIIAIDADGFLRREVRGAGAGGRKALHIHLEQIGETPIKEEGDDEELTGR